MSQTFYLINQREAANAIKKRKALGCNNIEAKLWQALGDNGIKAVWMASNNRSHST